jgi:hypothetical protein
MAISSELNRVQYSGMDFASIEDELLVRLQLKFASSYNDFAVSSLGIMLIDLFSYGLDTLSWYLDRRASDLFLSTARTRKSVARTARQLGYKMSAAAASSVDVTITLNQSYAFPITLPVGFQVYGPNGLIFEAQQSYTWAPFSATIATVTFAEGQTVQSIFYSDGTANQVYQIKNVPNSKFIVGPGSDGISKLVLEVAGIPWTESELLTFGSTNQFEIGYNDDPPTLRLGDNIAGNIPTNGAQMVLTYFATSGVAGTATAGQITKAVAPLVAGFTNIDIAINNPTGTIVGNDPEALNKARANAPLMFKSRGVNITKDDYEVRAGSFSDAVYGSIAVAKAISVKSAASDTYLNAKLADIEAIGVGFSTAVSTFDTTVATDLTTLTNAVVDIQTVQNRAITGYTANILSQSATISTDISNINTAVTVTNTEAADTDLLLAQILTKVNTLVGAEQVATVALINEAHAKMVIIISQVGSALATIPNVITSNGTILTTTNNLNTAHLAVIADVAIIDTQATSTTVGGIPYDITTLNTAVAQYNTDLSAATADILAHVDSYLSSDCQSNLIEVPVLALDSDGFYALPTIGLTKSLQVFLDAKKEVTQVVKVVSAASVLVAANVDIHVKVLKGYVEGNIRSRVEAAILSVLKARKFGANLELSELYWVVSPTNPNKIDGISAVNITITGPIDHLDLSYDGFSSGDLIITDSEVVTRGVITVTSEVVA